MKREDSGLLELLNSRASWNGPPYKKPKWEPKDLERIREAAQVHGRANPSDPYAESRMRLHLLEGLDDATAVNAAATSVLLSRQRRMLDAET